MEIWKRDEKKLKTIEEERGIKIITIWESDLPEFKKLMGIINERRI
jgi:G:T-mismatch repair DNA endonuclease (very short patch repair protein)